MTDPNVYVEICAGRLAESLREQPQPYGALAEGERVLKEALAEGRLVTPENNKWSTENVVGCAGAIAQILSVPGFWYALAAVNNASPADADGRITDFGPLARAIARAGELI